MKHIKEFFKGYNSPGGIKELLQIAIPMIIAMACDGIMTFTDRLFLAKLGPEQMNAALGGGVAVQVLTFLFIGLIGYSSALVAQYLGANEKERTSIVTFQAILISIAAYPLILLVKPVIFFLFKFANIPPVQLGYQFEYSGVLLWGAVFVLLRQAFASFFSGLGRTKIVMVATLTAMIVNVVMDYILIFGKLGFPQLGVSGAAIATNIGAFSAVLVLSVAYFRKSNLATYAITKSFHYNKEVMKKLLFYGYPAGLEMFLNFFAFSTMVSLFHAKGEHIATATTIMFNWDLVSFIPLIGIEIAVTSLVGRYMGAKEPNNAHHAAISGIKSGIFYSILIFIIFISIPEMLVNVFKPDSINGTFIQAFPIAVSMLKLATLYVLAEAMMVAIVGALRGAGDTHFTMMASVAMHWFLVPILYIALNIFNMSGLVGWLLIIIVFLLFCGAIGLRFRNGKWKNLNIIGN